MDYREKEVSVSGNAGELLARPSGVAVLSCGLVTLALSVLERRGQGGGCAG